MSEKDQKPDAATQAAVAAAVAQAVSGLNREGLQTGNPALFAALQSEFEAAGAKAERTRILAVQGQSMAGHEKLINELMFDGKTTGPDAAVAVLAAHRAQMGAQAAAHFSDAPAAAASSASAAGKSAAAKSREEMATEAEAYAKEHNLEFSAAWKALGFDKT